MHANENERLIARAVEVFEDSEQAELWLRSPNALLRGRTPLQALDAIGGAASLRRQLDWYAGKSPR